MLICRVRAAMIIHTADRGPGRSLRRNAGGTTIGPCSPAVTPRPSNTAASRRSSIVAGGSGCQRQIRPPSTKSVCPSGPYGALGSRSFSGVGIAGAASPRCGTAARTRRSGLSAQPRTTVSVRAFGSPTPLECAYSRSSRGVRSLLGKASFSVLSKVSLSPWGGIKSRWLPRWEPTSHV